MKVITRENISLACTVIGTACAIAGTVLHIRMMMHMHMEIKAVEKSVRASSALLIRAQQGGVISKQEIDQHMNPI